MSVWRTAAHSLALAWVMASCSTHVPETPPDGSAVPMDADVAREDAGHAEDSAVTRADGGGACSVGACSARLGLPPVPDRPCGHCWAQCGDDGECGAICFEAATCVFTAGCGPNCEPLCDTTSDCLLDDVCTDGVCAAPRDASSSEMDAGTGR